MTVWGWLRWKFPSFLLLGVVKVSHGSAGHWITSFELIHMPKVQENEHLNIDAVNSVDLRTVGKVTLIFYPTPPKK